jgi:hypothetical protein
VTLPKARLGKDGELMICFGQACAEPFARRVHGPDSGVLVFTSTGWVRDGRRWSMPDRARRRMLDGRRQVTRRSQTADVRTELPVEIRCPKCGRDQVADPVALRATVLHLPEDPIRWRRRLQRRNRQPS